MMSLYQFHGGENIHDFQGIFIRMRDHNGLGKTSISMDFFSSFFSGGATLFGCNH